MVNADNSCLSGGLIIIQIGCLSGRGRLPTDQSALIKLTGWTFAMASHDDTTINIIKVI